MSWLRQFARNCLRILRTSHVISQFAISQCLDPPRSGGYELISEYVETLPQELLLGERVSVRLSGEVVTHMLEAIVVAHFELDELIKEVVRDLLKVSKPSQA